MYIYLYNDRENDDVYMGNIEEGNACTQGGEGEKSNENRYINKYKYEYHICIDISICINMYAYVFMFMSICMLHMLVSRGVKENKAMEKCTYTHVGT
jgi:hypothetical protein